MSESHPEIARLRSLAEGTEDEARDASLAAHVASCERCKRLVDLARREERAIRAALPVEPPKGLLEGTLRALDAEAPRAERTRLPDSGRRRARSSARPRPIFAALLAAAVLLAGICLARALMVEREEIAEEAKAPPEVQEPKTKAPTPEPKPEKPPVEKPAETTEAPPAEKPEAPAPKTDTPTAPEKPLVTPPEPPAEKPAPEAPPTETKPEAPVIAVLRSGRLTASGRVLSPGDSIPPSLPLDSVGQVELESAGAAKLALAPRTRIVVKEGEKGEVVFQIGQGKAFVRSLGEKRYALASDDARATPLGTAFVFAVETGRTRVSTIEGNVHCQVERSTFSVDVRAGYEADLSRGKAPDAPRPLEPTKALSWLPAASRPAKLPKPPEILRSFGFEEGIEGFTKGVHREGGARGSAGCIGGVPGSDYALVVELDQHPLVLTIDPDLWIEATVKVDKKTTVALQVWDPDRKENLALMKTVEPGVWTTIAAPLRDFGDSRGKPRTTPLGTGTRSTCFSVFAGSAGDKLELLVDDVRFSLEKRDR